MAKPELVPALFGLLLASPSAWGCSLITPVPFRVVGDSRYEVVPERPVVTDLRVQRGTDPVADDGRLMRTSCDDVGWVTIVLQQPSHDPHLTEDVGYLLELQGGSLPDGLVLPEIPWLGDTLVLPWLDVGVIRERPINFQLGITPIDIGGQRGPALQISIYEQGRPEFPSACAGGPLPPAGWWLTTALIFARRPRRR